MTPHRIFIGALVAIFAVAPFVLSIRIISPLTYIGLAVLVGVGLIVLTGVARMTSFGQAAFCGLAAYTTAVLTTQYAWSPIAALPASLLVTAFVALLLGLLTVRLAGHYLVLGTLVWAIGLFYLFGNLPGLGGFNGISGLPPISLFGVSITTPFDFYIVIWLLVALSFLAATNLLDSRTGRAIRSLPTEIMAESFGVATGRLRIKVFVFAALLAGVSGWLHAHYIRIVNPSPFSINASIDYLFMVVIGGVGQLGGALIGPIVFEAARSWLRETLPVLFGRAGGYEVAVFGILVVVMLQNAGGGLMSFIARWLPAPPTAAGATEGRTAPAPATSAAGRKPAVGTEYLQEFRRPCRRAECLLRHARRRNSRADWPEWCWQEHNLQLADRPAPAQRRRGSLRGQADRLAGAKADCRSRHVAHLPACGDAVEDERARKCRARCAFARSRRLLWGCHAT